MASINTILINYDAYKNGYVKQVTDNMVNSLLKDEDVVLFGEGNFTFTVALAAIRGSWDEIVSTRFEAESRGNPSPMFKEVQKECIDFCRKNGELLWCDDDTITECIEAVEKVQQQPEENWLFGIDATNTPDSLIVQGKVVLFQCPWVPIRNMTGELITSFLRHMSMKQNQGDYVLIGIATLFPFVKDYNLEDLLGEKLSRGTDKLGKYDFVGADNTFIQEILKHGYRHMSCHSDRDIHETIIKDHITLVFQKK